MYLLLVGVLVVSIVIGIIVLAVANKSCDDENNDPRQQQKTYDEYINIPNYSNIPKVIKTNILIQFLQIISKKT